MRHERKTTYSLTLLLPERSALEAVTRRHALPAGFVQRARAVLLIAEGQSLSEVARRVGRSRRYVYKWIVRYCEQGLKGLDAKQGRKKRDKSEETNS